MSNPKLTVRTFALGSSNVEIAKARDIDSASLNQDGVLRWDNGLRKFYLGTLSEIVDDLGVAEHDSVILGWIYSGSYRLVSGTRDVNGALTAGTVEWPDGATGIYTATTVSVTFPALVDAYTVTRTIESVTITYEQPAVTRDLTGAITVQPAIIVS